MASNIFVPDEIPNSIFDSGLFSQEGNTGLLEMHKTNEKGLDKTENFDNEELNEEFGLISGNMAARQRATSKRRREKKHHKLLDSVLFSQEGNTALLEMHKTNDRGLDKAERFDNEELNEKFGLLSGNMAARKRVTSKRNREEKHQKRLDLENFAGLSDDKLERMPVKELNKRIQGLSAFQVKDIRKRRRNLKNRKYSLKCRDKHAEKRVNIADENAKLEKELLQTRDELRKIRKERNQFKKKYTQLFNTFSAMQSTAMTANKAFE